MTDEDTPRTRVAGIAGGDERTAPPDGLERALAIAIDSMRDAPGTSAGRWVACAFAPLDAWPSGERGARLRASARAAVVRERAGRVRLLFRKLGELLEVITADFEIVAPAATRGDGDAGLMVRRRLGGHDLTVHASCGSPGRFNVTLDLRGSDRPAVVRFCLLRGGRELVSEVARSGRAHLPNLGRGTYRLVISDDVAPLGELDLTFEEAAA